jgi:hypothetical protein
MSVLLGKYKVPKRYIPVGLVADDSLLQKKYLMRSRKAYKKGKYIDRPVLRSFTSKASPHVRRATHMYKVDSMEPNAALAKATGCSQKALEDIIRKGEGAYYSSGSRPNQTAQSWGYARLGSSLTGGPSSQVDYHILEKGCSKKSRPLRLANKTRKSRKMIQK